MVSIHWEKKAVIDVLKFSLLLNSGGIQRYKKRKCVFGLCLWVCDVLANILICMHMCMYKRDRVERRTWLLEAPGVQSQRQNTDREIHSRHTPLTPISLSAPQTSLHFIVLLYALALIYPFLFQAFSIIFIFDSCTFQMLSSHNPCFPPWSIFPTVNTALSNPFQILLPSILPRLTAHLTSFPSFPLSLNAC